MRSLEQLTYGVRWRGPAVLGRAIVARGMSIATQ
jgi:hypothetical protein